MDPMDTSGDTQQLSNDPFPSVRSYQIEALEAAIKQNTIVFLETGSGKTLIAIMLLRFYAHQIRKPSPFFAVFLVPTVVLVPQQSKYLMMHTDLKAGKYWGDLGVDYWDAATWKKQVDEFEVLVMTPQILLDALSHSFLKLEMIKVLIFDECHHARGNHAYARIMREFYHENVNSINSPRPRIFGMTASLVKAKGSNSESDVWEVISQLENLMNSKVYTCASESVLAEYIPFSTPKLKCYSQSDVPNYVHERINKELETLKQKHELNLASSSLSETMTKSSMKKLDKLLDTFLFCLKKLGVWLAFKAAETSSRVKNEISMWDTFDARGEAIIRNFSLDASKIFAAWFPSGQRWSIGANKKADMESGYLTPKVTCLVESLIEYRELKDLRCIIFVERIITAVVLQSLLNELFSHTIGWKTAYTAGHNHFLQAQSRQEQNKIVEEFRKGVVNIIVATSMLEEGLDVQSCNLVIRFDPSATVCSFIQSRGRARMQNSVFLVLVESGDECTLNQVQRYLKSGDVMRQQSLNHGSDPCMPLNKHEEACYKVISTGAIVNLSSSVSLLHFYCSRLPSDGYFKPFPRFVFDKVSESCTLHLPRSCSIQTIVVHGQLKTLKQLACLEACKALHKIGALTDNLVPDIVEEEADVQHLSYTPYIDEQVQYVPSQLVGSHVSEPVTQYYCYLIELTPDFEYAIEPQAIWLAVRSQLQLDEESLCFDLYADRGCLVVKIRQFGEIRLTSEEVHLCQMFQNAVFRVLIDHDLNRLKKEVLASFQQSDISYYHDFLILPWTGSCQNPLIDWTCVCSIQISRENFLNTYHLPQCTFEGNDSILCTYNGFLLCPCALENCLVYTPHNNHLYCVSGIFDNLNGNSLLKLKDDRSISYKDYYKKRHGVKLLFDTQPLLRGKRIFTMQNNLQKCVNRKAKESTNSTVELPPELCYVVMSPVSVAVFYSFSYCPSILHRIESLLLAADIKRMNADFGIQNDVIPTIKVLEAITTKRCQEHIHLESLETLGDSFLKYAVTRQLFMTYEKQHEGLLSIKREHIISNVSLCKLGCLRKIPGYIRNESFDPKTWIVPGDYSEANVLDMESNSIIFVKQGRRKIKSKTVADVVEALIGAYLISGGKGAALSFMKWLGIEVDSIYFHYTMPLSVSPSSLVNIDFFESLLNYSFRDASLLVEALTHGSYMLPEISRCYQRLEFLGDAVLDYVITKHLYNTHPGSSPGLLTDLRSASVNNDFYARCAVKIGLHKHLLHASQELHQRIASTLDNFEQLSTLPSFGWESESIFPKVLGDVIESIAGALLVDSGYDPEIVFRSIQPLLGPMITPEMLKIHPVRELTELCQKEYYNLKKAIVTCKNGKASVEVEVEVNGGVTHKESCSAVDRKTAKRLACKAILKKLKSKERLN